MTYIQKFDQNTVAARAPPMDGKADLRITQHAGVAPDHRMKLVIGLGERWIVKVIHNHYVGRTIKN
jgi:hypothetical protein